MSAERVIFALLSNHAPLNALVPARRIFPGVLPQGTDLPAIGYRHIVSVGDHAVAASASTMTTSRIQVTATASSYPEMKQLLALVKQACHRRTGLIAGVKVQHVRSDTVGPDPDGTNPKIFSQSVDFKVTFSEPN